MKFVILKCLQRNFQSFWVCKMRKLKKFELLRVKEKLKRQKSVNELNQIELDSEKCENINLALEELLAENYTQKAEIGVNSFISNRHLVRKMMDQKEIISNRIDFLEREKSSILIELGKSKVKDEILERKKIQIRRQTKETSLKKSSEPLGSTKPVR